MKIDKAGMPLPDEHAPVPVVLLALEVGEDPDHLRWRLNGDVFEDLAGFHSVPAAVARQQIAAKRRADETARLTREAAAAQQHAENERHNAERDQMLTAVNQMNERFGRTDSALATLTAANLDSYAADQEPFLAELAERERNTIRYDADGRRVDANGNPIKEQS